MWRDSFLSRSFRKRVVPPAAAIREDLHQDTFADLRNSNVPTRKERKEGQRGEGKGQSHNESKQEIFSNVPSSLLDLKPLPRRELGGDNFLVL